MSGFPKEAPLGRSLLELPGDGADLLLTDVVMPRLAGPELAIALREVHPRARVLFLSGHAEHGVVKGGELQPGVELLVKPFTPEVLLRQVDELLRG
jgi:two-component SAPR family response regulator